MFLAFLACATVLDNNANEYVTVFRDPGTGASKFHVLSDEMTTDGQKTTLLQLGEKKAWLLEAPDGKVTLVIGEEALTAPKPGEKEPTTSLSYFSMAYANAAAPKPKKKGLLGDLGGSVLGLVTGNLFGAGFIGSLGSVTRGSGAVAAMALRGVAMEAMTQTLGRATSTASMTTGSDPYMVSEVTRVDKTTMVETLFLRRASLTDIPNPASPKQVTAQELFEAFSKFMTSDLPSEDKD